jgi:hypothetical protein
MPPRARNRRKRGGNPEIEKVKGLRKRSKTVKNYNSGQKLLLAWLKESPDWKGYVRNDTIRLPLPSDAFLEFVDSRRTDDKGKLTSYSTLEGYKSAYADLYDRANAVQDADCYREIKRYYAGLKNKHADEKEQGQNMF